MPIRRINRVGRVYPKKVTRNQQRLLDFASQQLGRSFCSINAVREEFGAESNEETYELLRQQYNENVPYENSRLNQLETANQDAYSRLEDLLVLQDVDEITLNMADYRPQFTLEEILKRIVLSYINEDDSAYYTLQIGENYYTLNDNVRNRLITMVKRDLIIDEEEGSDGILLQEIKDAETITIRRWERTNEYETPDGAFFKYKNITEMDFSKYGVFNKHGEWGEDRKFQSYYEDNCLIYALKEYSKENESLTIEAVEEVKHYVKNLKVPMNVMPEISNVLQHRIKVNNINHEHNYAVFGKEFDNEISLGLIDGHYFLNDTTNYTAFAIENYHSIKHLKDFQDIYTVEINGGNKYYKRKKNRHISSFQAIKLLMQHKDTHLEKLTTQEKDLAHTQFYNSVEESFESLKYSTTKNVRKVIKNDGENGKKKKIKQKFTNVFFDFETNTNEGNHQPYLCCCYFEENGKIYKKKFIGYDCGKQLLDFVPNRSLLIAHNATYDYRFIVKLLEKFKAEISKVSKLVSCDAYYGNKHIKVKDSYALITMRLSDFNRNLKLGGGMRKEVISHKLYTKKNIEKRFIDIDYAVGFLKNDEDIDQFYQNLNDWELIGENNTFDCLEYSANYCLKDCEILAKGYNVFRRMVFKNIGLDIDDILTIPSLAHKYFIKNDCYDGVNELSGTPQRFIQKSVVGGRCMTNSNLMILCYDILNDFDAVSLYPSAMSMMGFLKGIPKELKENQLNYDFLREQDGYFLEIVVDKVGKKRQFPLLSFKDENGVRNWTNDMVGKTMYVNKYSLEDAIEFQSIEFTVVRGYYFNEDRNYTIKEVIQNLFNERKKWKKDKNPVELIYKLIMNSAYGKSIMKPIETENRFFDDEESYQKYMSKNYNYVDVSYPFGNGKYKVKKIKAFNQHFNLAQVGSEILSMAKRLMNRVVCLAEDLGLDVYYTDTDSIHIKDAHVPILSRAYKNKYQKTLIGKELGQFHNDFEMKVSIGVDEYGVVKENCLNIVSIMSLFLAKKVYLDALVGEHPTTGNKVCGFHIRMKGVCEGAVLHYISEDEMIKDVWDIYIKLYNGEAITFDLIKGGSLHFKYDNKYDVITDPIFTREVKFSGSRIMVDKNGMKSKIDNGKIVKRKNEDRLIKFVKK